MATAEEKAVRLTAYMVEAPGRMRSVMLLVLLGFVFGALYGGARGGWMNAGAIIGGAVGGIFLITVPALLSAFTCKIAKRGVAFRRILFLSFVGAIVYAAFYLWKNWPIGGYANRAALYL